MIDVTFGRDNFRPFFEHRCGSCQISRNSVGTPVNEIESEKERPNYSAATVLERPALNPTFDEIELITLIVAR